MHLIAPNRNFCFRTGFFQLFFVINAFFLSFSCGQDKRPVEDLVKELATRFCMAEFNGDVSARIDLVAYDDAHLSKMDPMFKPGVYSSSFDPIKVVLSFKIGIPRLERDQWIIDVEYEEVAIREKPAMYGGRIKRHSRPKRIRENLTIRSVQTKMAVFNPSLPHVGRNALLQEYNTILLRMEKHVYRNPKSSKEQLESYERLKKEYELLNDGNE